MRSRIVTSLGMLVFAPAAMAADFYWHGADGNANTLTNWTQFSTGTGTTPASFNGNTWRFDGTGPNNDANATMTADIPVGNALTRVDSTAVDPYTGTLSDGGFTLTAANFKMVTGSLAMSGVLNIHDPSNATTSPLELGIPAGQSLATLAVLLNAPGGGGNGDSLTLRSDVTAAQATLGVGIGSASFVWEGFRLTLTGGGTHDLAGDGGGTITHSNASGTPRLRLTGAGATVRFPADPFLPSLEIDASATLEARGITSLAMQTGGGIALGEGATLTLGTNVTDVTLPTGGTITGSGAGGIARTGAAGLVLPATGAAITRSDGVAAGDLSIAVPLTIAGPTTVTNTGSTGALVLSGDLAGPAATTVTFAGSGAIRVTGTDNRATAGSVLALDAGGSTALTWNGSVATPASVALQVSGTGHVLRGTGSLPALTINAAGALTLRPGDGATYGTLTLASADLGQGNGANVVLRARDAGSPVSDVLAVTGALTLGSGAAVNVDLSQRTTAGRIDGVITYGGGSTIALASAAIGFTGLGTGWSAQLVDDAANQEIDLLVTAPPPDIADPGIDLSNNRTTLYAAICPGTAANLAQLKAVVAAAEPGTVRAFSWDAAARRYVELPAEPAGGLQPWHGVFIATLRPLDLGFTTGSQTAPMTLTGLAPGWNLIGLPPILDTGSLQAETPLLQMSGEYDETGTWTAASPVTTLVGDTAWWWDGGAYRATGTLSYWKGYWVYVQDLGTAGGDSRLVRPAGLSGGGGGGGGGSLPPDPPGAAMTLPGSNDSCGSGSGIALLLLALCAAFARRRAV